MGWNSNAALSGAWGAATRQVSQGYGGRRTPRTAAASYRMQSQMPVSYAQARAIPRVISNRGVQSGYSRAPLRRYPFARKAQVYDPEMFLEGMPGQDLGAAVERSMNKSAAAVGLMKMPKRNLGHQVETRMEQGFGQAGILEIPNRSFEDHVEMKVTRSMNRAGLLGKPFRSVEDAVDARLTRGARMAGLLGRF